MWLDCDENIFDVHYITFIYFNYVPINYMFQYLTNIYLRGRGNLPLFRDVRCIEFCSKSENIWVYGNSMDIDIPQDILIMKDGSISTFKECSYIRGYYT